MHRYACIIFSSKLYQTIPLIFIIYCGRVCMCALDQGLLYIVCQYLFSVFLRFSSSFYIRFRVTRFRIVVAICAHIIRLEVRWFSSFLCIYMGFSVLKVFFVVFSVQRNVIDRITSNQGFWASPLSLNVVWWWTIWTVYISIVLLGLWQLRTFEIWSYSLVAWPKERLFREQIAFRSPAI